MPSRVEFRDRGVVFAACEDRIKAWVRCIDQWIASANEGIALAEARQRLTDVDKYRDL